MPIGLLVHLGLISLPVVIKAELLWTVRKLLTVLNSGIFGGQNSINDDRKFMSL